MAMKFRLVFALLYLSRAPSMYILFPSALRPRIPSDETSVPSINEKYKSFPFQPAPLTELLW